MVEKIKAMKKKPNDTSGSAEIYHTHSQARSNMINFGRFTSRVVQVGFFFKAKSFRFVRSLSLSNIG